MDLEPAGRRSVRPWLVRALVAVVLVLGWTSGALRDVLDHSPARAYLDVGGRSIAVPEPAAGAVRVLPPVPPTTTGTHAFLHPTDDGAPLVMTRAARCAT